MLAVYVVDGVRHCVTCATPLVTVPGGEACMRCARCGECGREYLDCVCCACGEERDPPCHEKDFRHSVEPYPELTPDDALVVRALLRVLDEAGVVPFEYAEDLREWRPLARLPETLRAERA